MSSAPIDLLGTWQMVRAEFDGENAPDEVAQHTEIRFTPSHYSVLFAGQTADSGSIEFPPIANLLEGGPAHAAVAIFSLHGQQGTNAGRTIPCIGQRVGDRLRICFGLAGMLPTEFSTHVGQQRYLATYRLV